VGSLNEFPRAVFILEAEHDQHKRVELNLFRTLKKLYVKFAGKSTKRDSTVAYPSCG
jgi:hypothetical protein